MNIYSDLATTNLYPMSGHTPLTMKFVLPTSPAEVVSKSNDQNILQQYIVKTPEQVSSQLPYMDPAIIDLQRLSDSEEELQKFKSLLSSWGAIQLVNHGIENSTLDQVLQVTRQFFDLSLKEKEKYARYVSQNWKLDQMEGYGCDRMSEGQAFNWCDRLFLVLHPESRRKPQYWPDESIPKFREIVDDYLNGLIRIREILLKSISKMLNLPEEYLISKYGNDGFIATRFNLYPTSPYPDRILGSRRHTDINLFTILLLDKEVEGLHVEKDEQWYIVPIVPNALVFNIADMLEIITNGSVKSPCHRVVTDAERERLSIVSAFGPAPNSEIGPLEELIDEENPIRYPTLKNSSEVAADYFANGKIFIKEIRKFGAHILDQEREELNKET